VSELADGVDSLDQGDDAAPLLLRRHREHLLPGRPHRLRVSYSPGELAAVRAGAARAGLTLSGFVAAAALAVAREEALPVPPVAEQAVAELARAHAQVRRIGVNLNQAAAKLNSGQTPPVWLERAVALAERALLDVQTAAAQLHGSHGGRGPARPVPDAESVRLGIPALARPDR
jgi:antitoxin component of RelBE/YafQ-DinJ toxin-antitoxin module